MDINNSKSKLTKFKEKFLWFWRTDNNKVSLVRDILVAFLFVFIILLALWAYTGQWLGSPMVAIESGSMMHQNEPFGRIGTIDAGDMVFLVKVNSRSDVVTNIEKGSGNYQYWDYGDVIVYKPYGDESRDQIIHRAMAWVEYNEKYDTYTIEGYGLYNVTTITIPELGLQGYKCPNSNDAKPHSGYITKGDNNDRADQTDSYLCDQLIKVEWISGKARGELPWIGTLNLLFNDIISGKNTLKNVPGDSITCLIILIIILISIPITTDIYFYFKEKKKLKQ